MSEQHQTNGKFMAGFFLGGLLGALILFFLGTKDGKKTGKMLEKKGQDILEDFQDKLEDIEEKGRDLASRGEEIKDQIVEKLEDTKEDLTEQAANKLDDALSQIEDLNEKTLKTTANLRKVFKNIPKKHCFFLLNYLMGLSRGAIPAWDSLWCCVLPAYNLLLSLLLQ